jgi:uroporphyrinogen decarboxylase
MNSRERVLKAMSRQGKPDRTPFEISWGAFTPELMDEYRRQTGSKLEPDEYFDFDTRSVNLNPTRKKTDFQKYFPAKLPDNIVIDEWGIGGTPGSEKHFLDYKYHPLAGCQSAEDVFAYEWPDVDADYRYEGLEKKIAAYKERGYAVMGELYQTIYETAWLLRGMERCFTDFYDNPEIVDAICEKMMLLRIKQAQKYAQLGVDILRLGDDVTCQRGWIFGRELYRKHFKERTRKIVQAAKNIKPDILVFIHSDGKVDELVPELIDIGIDILNPVQPECNDLQKIVDNFGQKISFWGGIGTQTTMPFGTPETVREKTQETMRILGKYGNLLLAPTHILEPEVPWKNVTTFIETVKSCIY